MSEAFAVIFTVWLTIGVMTTWRNYEKHSGFFFTMWLFLVVTTMWPFVFSQIIAKNLWKGFKAGVAEYSKEYF